MIHPLVNIKNKQSERKSIVFWVIIGISVFALSFAPVRGVFTRMIYFVTPGIWSTKDSVANTWDSLTANFHSKDILQNENASLSAEVNRLQAQILDRNLLAEKVIRLEESLGRVRSDDRVVAGVLAGPGRSPYDTIVVDAGAEEGVKVGDTVVYAGSGVVGEIIETTPETSKVKLFSYPGEDHTVVVGPRSIPVVARGRGMGNFEAKLPENSPVEVGDQVLTFKEGLILGTVALIEEKQAEPVKKIYFRSAFNITEMRSVEVIITKQP